MSWSNEEIIASLRYPGKLLPEDALREAIRHYDDIKPELYAALKLSPEEVKAVEADNEDGYMLQFFAMYLAAEKRDATVFPMIRDFFNEYGEDACEINGDMVCEHLDRILASLCGDAETLKAAAKLPGLDIWARSAFFSALGILFHLGQLDRAKLIDWFREWLESDDLSQQERTCIAHVCCDLSLSELEQVLVDALCTERIDPQSMRHKDISGAMQLEQMPEYTRRHYALVDNAIDVLQMWYRDLEYDIYAEMFAPEERALLAFLLSELNRKREEEPVTLAFLHGCTFSIVLTPEPLSVNEWLPQLFGGEMPPFDSIEDANKNLGVLMQIYNRMNQQRLEGSLHCPFDAARGTSPEWLDAIREWCRGFVCGIELRQEYWTQPDNALNAEEINSATMTLIAIADDAAIKEITGETESEGKSYEQNEFLAHAMLILPDAVRVLTEHTQALDAIRIAPVRSSKIGRNIPCPCGSGKKFKKCCGAPGKMVH